MRNPVRMASVISLGVLCVALAFMPDDSTVVRQAMAQQPPAQERPDAWYPRTEKVAPDEMLVVALGTGMPTPITRAQKSSA